MKWRRGRTQNVTEDMDWLVNSLFATSQKMCSEAEKPVWKRCVVAPLVFPVFIKSWGLSLTLKALGHRFCWSVMPGNTSHHLLDAVLVKLSVVEILEHKAWILGVGRLMTIFWSHPKILEWRYPCYLDLKWRNTKTHQVGNHSW